MLENIKNHLRFKKEPVAYVAALLAGAYVAYEVAVNGVAPQNVVVENLGEILVGGLATLLVRLGVYSPATVEALKAQHEAELYGDGHGHDLGAFVDTGEGVYEER